MNENIEEIYTQMFAPQPIPQAVKELYARAQHFADRIDSPQMPMSMLVTIAACATVTGKTKPVNVDIDEVDETIPVQPDSYASNEATGTPPVPSNGETDTNDALESSGVATGPMDVPAVVHQGDDARRYNDLIRMTVLELREHAKEFYGYRPRLGYKKPKIIDLIMHRKPIK
ncbi:MAG: hypothetical protein MUP81_04620 [Dehalococcoidia bacterium]|nr:hypothetical protein [Dehalococcoidia bacterium]